MTCERVMEVLRENKDSVMAVLEAFVYDPLLNWRLMDSKCIWRGGGGGVGGERGLERGGVMHTLKPRWLLILT